MRRARDLLPAALLVALFAHGGGGSETTDAHSGAAGGGRSAGAAAQSAPRPDAKPVSAKQAARHIAGRIGSRPAGGRGERRAHAYVAKTFRAAGLAVTTPGFRVPGRGRSHNVIGELDTPRDCLVIVMAHTDSVPPGLGANDNASGVGVLVGLAPRLAGLDPPCDVWLVATGAEERVVIGTDYHVGAAALVKTVRSRGRAGDLRLALSVDMVGRGRRFYLRSPQPSTRPGVEEAVLAAAERAGVTVRWARDSGSGNSDHRELELAGLPAAVLEAWRGEDACHHEGCDRPGRLQAGALARAQRIAAELLGG
ncbi:MAG: M28 family metallopeptidase [Solirubrobacterales bacterium]